ncbi:MAG: glycosyltransferase family 4 protein [Aigarchaeota archaeon]|nr:glycosyltransferase family 4 protein [Aigarchaeota archaeon]MDW8093041.1 glycosyltransferase family 4 protein [Nitrososphaerota archaeon]
MDPLKIIHFSRGPGGVMNEVVRRQLEMGHAVEIYCYPRITTQDNLIIYNSKSVKTFGPDIYRTKIGKKQHFELFNLIPFRLFRELNDLIYLSPILRKADVFHVHGPIFYQWPKLYSLGLSGWGYAARLNKDLGVVLTIHSGLPSIIKHYKALRGEMSFAHQVTAPSKFVTDLINCHHIPNGVDTRFFKPLKREEIDEYRRWFIGGEKAVILSVGNWYPVKRHDLLMEILGKLKESVRRQVQVVIAGLLNENDRYMKSHYKRAKSVARKYDPVVMFDMGSAYPVHGFNAFVARDNDQFVEHLELLLTDEGLRRRMGQNARESSLAFDWDLITKRYLEVYHMALDQR